MYLTSTGPNLKLLKMMDSNGSVVSGPVLSVYTVLPKSIVGHLYNVLGLPSSGLSALMTYQAQHTVKR